MSTPTSEQIIAAFLDRVGNGAIEDIRRILTAPTLGRNVHRRLEQSEVRGSRGVPAPAQSGGVAANVMTAMFSPGMALTRSGESKAISCGVNS
jgi:hypothetical protein